MTKTIEELNERIEKLRFSGYKVTKQPEQLSDKAPKEYLTNTKTGEITSRDWFKK